jgi:hypothetical protein
MTSNEERLVSFLLDGWENALHNVDTLIQVTKDVPDAKKQFEYWQRDTLRVESTIDRFYPLREAAQAVIEGAELDSQLRELAETMRQTLH